MLHNRLSENYSVPFRPFIAGNSGVSVLRRGRGSSCGDGGEDSRGNSSLHSLEEWKN